MKFTNPNNNKKYKKWVADTIKELYTLEGISLIEKSQEFFAICHDNYAEAEVKHTQNTNDKLIDKHFSFLRDEIRPLLKEASAKIAKKIIQRNHYPIRFQQYIREAKVTHKLYNQEILRLEKEEGKLEAAYQKKFGFLTIKVKGKIYPISMTSKFLESFDRNIRKEAWVSMKKALLKNQYFFEDTYIKLIKIRNQIAKIAKCKSYTVYQFKKKLRDYSPKNCYEYHRAVKKYVVPKVTELQRKRKKILKLSKLYPYDTSFSIIAKYEINPFKPDNEKKLILGTKKALEKIDPQISKHFNLLYKNKELDLLARKYKAPGGYHMPFLTKPLSFIFMNATGTHNDLNTLAHEVGHSWHHKLTKKLKYPFEKAYSTEVAEVASMFLEYLASRYLNYFYTDEELIWALIDQWESEIVLISWIAIIDKFQFEIYKIKNLNKNKLRRTWLNISREFRSGEIYWNDDRDLEQINYVRQLHLYTDPFYYIEYAISLIAAVKLIKIFEKNKKEALSRYNKGLSMGNTVSTKKVYKKGFKLPLKFGEKQVKETLDFFNKSLERVYEKLNSSSK